MLENTAPETIIPEHSHSHRWCRTPKSQARATCCAKTAGSCIVKRRQRAFKITGLTWIVERSFAWLGRNRRLNEDYEYCVQSSETLIEIAATRLFLNRLAQEW